MTVPSPTATLVVFLSPVNSALNVANRWDTIQNVFYRKEELYTMSWKIPNLSDYIVAAAKYGGAIGQLADSSPCSPVQS